MINAEIYRQEKGVLPGSGKITGFLIDGHANTAPHGQDIYCAGVSTVTQSAYLCIIQHLKRDIDIDHIIPQKYGGSDELYNLQCMCKHCNRSKQAKLKGVPGNFVKHNLKRAANKVLDNLKEKINK